jgi:hypothetical protein
VSEQVFEHHEVVAVSATVSSFEQTLDKRVQRFDTAGKTLVGSVVELAICIRATDRNLNTRTVKPQTRPLNLDFHNESVRRILESITGQVPGYSVSFSGGVVDVFAARGREDSSNLLNKVIKDFAVT